MASDDEDGIFKVETVPPPEGESDVYNAPTKVGSLAGSIVEEIVQQARRQAELSAQGRSPHSRSPDAREEEPAVVDPMKLLAVEQLAAREEAALRPAGLPTGLAIPERFGPDSVPVVVDEPAPTSAPPRDVDGAGVAAAERAPLDVSGVPAFPAGPVAPVVAPLAVPQPAPDEQPVVRPRRSNRVSTAVLLALVLVFLAFGVYRLRR